MDPNDPGFLDWLKGIGGFARDVVDPTRGRGIWGFGKEVAQDIQRRPLQALTLDMDAVNAGTQLSRAHPILGAGLSALGIAGVVPGVPEGAGAMGRRLMRSELADLPRAIPAIRNTKTGEVFTGPTHPSIVFDGVDAAGEPLFKAAERGDLIDGFVDNRSADFVERMNSSNLLAEAGATGPALRAENIPGYEKIPMARLGHGATGDGVPRVGALADEYMSARPGVEYPSSFEYLPADQQLGRDVADFYESAPHAPDDPAVQAAYDAFAQETKDQYNFLTERGVKFEPNTGDPYATSAEMIADVRNNQRLKFFLTDMKDFPADHPLGKPSGVMGPNGEEMVYNDLFRAVHDYFGHAKEGVQFGARGEFNAANVHSAMYSEAARPAMLFETHGQNSWVNFGPQMRNEAGDLLRKGDPGYIPAADRAFAQQKANILPPEMGPPAARLETVGGPGITLPDGTFVGGSNHGDAYNNLTPAQREVVDAMSDEEYLAAEAFQTSRGRTVGREEAEGIAIQAQQAEDMGLGGLQAEDLYPPGTDFAALNRGDIPDPRFPDIGEAFRRFVRGDAALGALAAGFIGAELALEDSGRPDLSKVDLSFLQR